MINIRHAASPTTIPRDAKPQHNLALTNQLVQKDDPRLSGTTARQLKRADQTARQRLNGIVGRVRRQVIRVDAEHVDLVLAPGEVGRPGREVELEAEGAGPAAGEVGEGDDEVLVIGVVVVLGDVEDEGDLGGAAGSGSGSGSGGYVLG